MAKARAIVKRRKAVRNIRKITKTMQMIATAKFQKSLRRAVGTKPYTQKVRELVGELAASVGNVSHPLLRRPSDDDRTDRIALIVVTSNRGLAGAYNGSVLRTAQAFIRQQEAAGKSVELYAAGKKGITFFNYQKRVIRERFDQFADQPKWVDVERVAQHFIDRFNSADPAERLDGVYICYMNFVSAGVQKPDVLPLLPLGGIAETLDLIGRQTSETERAAGAATELSERARDQARAQAAADTHHDEHGHRAAATRAGTAGGAGGGRAAGGGVPHAGPGMLVAEVVYDFSPAPGELLDYLLPLTVKTALFQAFLDAVTSENVARMVAMKSATDNADKMVKSLTMEYNRARQSQITTELSEIMGGVEAMKG